MVSYIAGGNLLARWQRQWAEASITTLQVFWDRTERDTLPLYEVRDTFDLELRHALTPGTVHDLIWGFGARITSDRLEDSFSITVDPDRRDLKRFNLFIQDTITIVRDRLHLVLGAKLEHDDFSGFEHQPQVRLLWAASQSSSLWASVARAVRTPSRLEHDFRGNAVVPRDDGGPPTFFSILGNPDLRSETVTA